MGRTFEEIQAMAVDPLSNDACRGYVIWTMENSGFKPKEITQAVTELYTAFYIQTIEEVARHYYNSSFLLRVKLSRSFTFAHFKFHL